MTARALSLLVIAALLLSQPASAQGGERARALTLYKAGVALHGRGEYEAAIAIFRRSLRVYRHENTLYAIGEAYRRLGQLRSSSLYYRGYAAMLAPAKRAAFERRLRRILGAARSKLLVTTDPPGASVVVNGHARGRTPRGRPLELSLAAGRHRVLCVLEGHLSVVRKVRAEFGEPVAVQVDLEPLARRGSTTHSTPKARTSQPGRTPSRIFFNLLIGPAVQLFDDSVLSASTTLETGVEGGLVLARGTGGLGGWDLHLHLTTLFAGIRDVTVDDSAVFINLALGLGARWFVQPRLWIDLRWGVGASFLYGASSDSFLFDDGQYNSRDESRVFTGLLLRPALGLGLRLWRGLQLSVYPFAMDYSPLTAGFSSLNPRLKHVLRYHVYVGVGWQ